MNTNRQSRRRLYGFILFNIIEETIIAIIAFILLYIFFPTLLAPGMLIVAVGLVLFTLVKIYSYWSSATIPVYDPLIGQEGIALTEFQQKEGGNWEGKVVVCGEHWKAQASEPIVQNSAILVLGITGLTLIVGTIPKKSQPTEN
jgi:membrane-bound ClpP family serine protease